MKDIDLRAPADSRGPTARGVLNAESALRVVLVLLAMWTGLSGLALTFFQDASDATIGGGLHGGQGAAAQRLLGVHLLVLAPLYGLLAWEPRRFRLLLWVPYAAQAGVVLTTMYDIGAGDRAFQDAALPLIVAVVFLALLLYVTFAGRDPDALPGATVIEGEASPKAVSPAPEEPLPEQPAPE
jgi:hypothetical protein